VNASPRVLAILHGLIGDTLMRVPALRALRREHPDMELLAIADPVTAPVLAVNPLFDHVLPWDRRQSSWGWQLDRIREIRQWGPDAALDFYFGSRTPWVAFASGAPLRVGPARSLLARLLFNQLVEFPFPAQQHMLDRFGAIVNPLGVGELRREWEFPVHESQEASMRENLARHGIWNDPDDVVLLVGAGDESKRMEPTAMATFVRELTGRMQRRVLLVEDRRDPALGEGLRSLPGVQPLPALGLPELGALFRSSALVVVPDTGAMHMALGCAPRVLTWFQSTDPSIHASSRPGTRYLYEVVCPWQPCDTREKARCHLECTESIGGSRLAAAAQELLEEQPWRHAELPARNPATVLSAGVPG
jgi:ADP-heptose:LPS heptosyltransferase